MKTRRTYSPDQKAKIVLSIIDGSKTVLEVSREYDIGPALIHKWRDQFIKQASTVFASPENKEDQQKLKRYEYVIAKLTTQNDFLDKVLTTLK